jgi:hypothetical protein
LGTTENLRPPAAVETTETKGRKSASKGTGRKKAADSGVVEEEDAVKGEDPAVAVDESADVENGSPTKRVTRASRRKAAEGSRTVTYEGMEGTDGEGSEGQRGVDESWDENAGTAGETADEDAYEAASPKKRAKGRSPRKKSAAA